MKKQLLSILALLLPMVVSAVSEPYAVPSNDVKTDKVTNMRQVFDGSIDVGTNQPGNFTQKGQTDSSDEFTAFVQQLQKKVEQCKAYLADLYYELEQKDPEHEAEEIWGNLDNCAYYLDMCYKSIDQATTVEELYDVEKMLLDLMAYLNTLASLIDEYEPVQPFTATTVEGIELRLKIISEDDKTVQVGDGKNPALSQSATGSVTIPATVGDYTVVAIGKWAFDGCKGIRSIYIPASVTSLADNFLGDCRNLTSLTVAADNPVYNSPANSNAIIKTGNKTLVAACNSTILPEGIETIGSYAFAYCDAFETLDLPDGVWSFYDYAFAYSSVKLIAAGGISQIGFSMGAFNCSKVEVFYLRQTEGTLSMFCNGKMWKYAFAPGWPTPTFSTYVIPEQVSIGDKVYVVSSLGSSAFYDCTELTELTIPASITAIEKGAFGKCTAIRTITSYITEPFTIDGEMFVPEVYAEATLYVPAGTKAKYEATDGWKNFSPNIVEMEVENTEAVTVGNALVAGFSSNKNLDFTSLEEQGVSAWIATGFRGGNVLLSRVYAVPAGEGVYVKAEKAGTYEVPVTEEEPFYSNLFVGVPDGATVNMYEDFYGETYLTLSLAMSKTTGKPGFFPNTAPKTYAAGKMYLHMPARLLPEYATTRLNEFSLGIEFEDDETTGISEASPLNDNGQMINDKLGEVYDLQGRKMEGQPTKSGLYIINGNKVVIK